MQLTLGDIGHPIPLRKGDVERRQSSGDLANDKAGGDGRAVIVKDGDKLRRVDIALVDQQHAHLAVAVLLDDEHFVVLGDKTGDLAMKREGAQAHAIQHCAVILERVEGLFHGGGGRPVIDYAEPRRLVCRAMDWKRYQVARRPELLLRPLHVAT